LAYPVLVLVHNLTTTLRKVTVFCARKHFENVCRIEGWSSRVIAIAKRSLLLETCSEDLQLCFDYVGCYFNTIHVCPLRRRSHNGSSLLFLQVERAVLSIEGVHLVLLSTELQATLKLQYAT